MSALHKFVTYLLTYTLTHSLTDLGPTWGKNKCLQSQLTIKVIRLYTVTLLLDITELASSDNFKQGPRMLPQLQWRLLQQTW